MITNKETVKIIDAPCGYGKTSWAIQQINNNPEKSYIYCTPFLDEIARIRQNCGQYKRFKEPVPYKGTKIDSFNDLLSKGEDIAVTHTTFLNATEETMELIKTGGYTLIIDEALDVVTDFNRVQTVENAPRQSTTKGDIKMLLDNNIIQIEKNNLVKWCGDNYGEECKFSEVQRFAKLGRLYCIDNSFMLTVFPHEIFKCFEDIYILTYLFGGSTLRYYLDMFNIQYELKSVSNTDGEYSIVDYNKCFDNAFRKKCKRLIHICDNKEMNNYRGNALSKSWYIGSKKDERLKKLKSNLGNYFRRCLKDARASNGDIMWTCPKDYKDKIKGAGYIFSRSLSAKDKQLPKDKLENLEKELSCFVPCNSKATNIYRNRWALAYCVNMHFNPMIRKFFTDNNSERKENGLTEILPDENLFALSCLIQWIFRSRIRDGKPVEIYIPSTRMRTLFTDWMNCEI